MANKVGCVVRIGKDIIILTIKELEHLRCYSIYFRQHMINLAILNLAPNVSLPEEIVDRNILLALLDKQVLSDNIDLLNFMHVCGYLMIEENFALYLLRNMNKLSNLRFHSEIIPAAYFTLYKLTNFDRVAYLLLWVLNFDYVPPLLKCQKNYHNFRKYLRNCIRSDSRFYQMYDSLPWKFEHLVAQCSCNRCHLDCLLRNSANEISEQINEVMRKDNGQKLNLGKDSFFCPMYPK